MTDLNWNLRLPNQLRHQLEPMARADGRDVSNLARHLLQQAANARTKPARESRLQD
jgi:hypothetical protein